MHLKLGTVTIFETTPWFLNRYPSTFYWRNGINSYKKVEANFNQDCYEWRKGDGSNTGWIYLHNNNKFLKLCTINKQKLFLQFNCHWPTWSIHKKLSKIIINTTIWLLWYYHHCHTNCEAYTLTNIKISWHSYSIKFYHMLVILALQHRYNQLNEYCDISVDDYCSTKLNIIHPYYLP